MRSSSLLSSIFRLRFLLVLMGILISGVMVWTAGQPKNEERHKPSLPSVRRVSVEVRSVAQSRSFRQSVSYPGLLVAKQEATVAAKVPGTVQSMNFRVGDAVKMGDVVAVVDDAMGVSYGTGIKASAVNQAKLGVDQAASAYRLAQSNYNDLLASSKKDLEQASLMVDQADTGEGNVVKTSEESLKAGEMAYKTATLAVEQAKLALEDRARTAEQAESDAERNAELVADFAFDTLKAVFVGLNSLTGLDESNAVVVPYESYLGGYRSQTLIDAKNRYVDTKTELRDFEEVVFAGPMDQLRKTETMAQSIKSLVDVVKILFENTVTGALLPQSSLDSIQQAVAGYQAQMGAVLAQINGARQMLENTRLGNSVSLAALEKTYDLAVQQQKSAAQNLESLKAQTKTQQDQAGFGHDQAVIQYQALKIKLDSALSAAKTQLESARLQHQNALLALASVSGNYQLIAPIDGVLTRQLVHEGDTVNPGQPLAVISRPGQFSVRFYVDADTLSSLRPGMRIYFGGSSTVSPAAVTSVSAKADEASRRFLVEAEPLSADPSWVAGMVVDVTADFERGVLSESAFWLPLSAIEVGQNGNLITVAEQGRAKKIPVSMGRIEGEWAEIETVFPPDTLIVVRGNRLANEGDYLETEIKSDSSAESLNRG